MLRALLFLCALLISAAGLAASNYSVRFGLTMTPGGQSAKGEITVKPGTGYVRTLTLSLPASRYSGFSADGSLAAIAGQKDRLLWTPPSAGGSFRYAVRITNKRSNGAFDAMSNPNWAIFRGDKVFPKAKVRAKGKSISELVFTVPKAWYVNVGYERIRDGAQRFAINDSRRSFDAPAGWVITGKIANRVDVIAGTKVIVSGPEGIGLRRQDMLALLSYNLPEMKRAFGTMPKILLIVSGPDPMWRGGLSGPNSLFLHADRPMISENGTSSLLHELTHSITRVRGGKNADWIAEGMAEFYAIEALRRSGGISDERYQSTLSELKSWSKSVKTLLVARSSAEVTARAALLMIELDNEIQKATNRKKSLDDVTRALIKLGKVSNLEFKKVVETLLGRPSTTLQSPLLK